jgi:hypothetical protein
MNAGGQAGSVRGLFIRVPSVAAKSARAFHAIFKIGPTGYSSIRDE